MTDTPDKTVEAVAESVVVLEELEKLFRVGAMDHRVWHDTSEEMYVFMAKGRKILNPDGWSISHDFEQNTASTKLYTLLTASEKT